MKITVVSQSERFSIDGDGAHVVFLTHPCRSNEGHIAETVLDMIRQEREGPMPGTGAAAIFPEVIELTPPCESCGLVHVVNGSF